jgi:hypothetical protein
VGRTEPRVLGARCDRLQEHAQPEVDERSAALADHPITVNLREDVMVDALNRWIGRLFDRENLDQTVAQLLGSQPAGAASIDVSAAKARRADAERRLLRFQAAIAAGADPAAVVEPMNQAQAERAAAQAEVDAASKEGKALAHPPAWVGGVYPPPRFDRRTLGQ